VALKKQQQKAKRQQQQQAAEKQAVVAVKLMRCSCSRLGELACFNCHAPRGRTRVWPAEWQGCRRLECRALARAPCTGGRVQGKQDQKQKQAKQPWFDRLTGFI
jgi:hypothetical protein